MLVQECDDECECTNRKYLINYIKNPQDRTWGFFIYVIFIEFGLPYQP